MRREVVGKTALVVLESRMGGALFAEAVEREQLFEVSSGKPSKRERPFSRIRS